MKKTLSFVALAAIATALLALPGTASAQAAFGGTFRGPHGSFSVGVGGPFVPQVGVYVPEPYADEVYLDPDNGYGFYYDSRWVACRPYGSSWIIAESPVFYSRPYVRDYGNRYYSRPSRDFGRGFVRREFRRDFRNDFRRFDGRNDSRRFDGRRDRRSDGRRDGRDGRRDGWR